MNRRASIFSSGARLGGVTVEMAVAALVILVPVLLALGELARLDRAARRLQFGAQRPVIATAMAENAASIVHHRLHVRS